MSKQSKTNIHIDPKAKYSKPPFPTIKQEIPGMESQMQPRPDFGRETYLGSGRLKDKVSLITGGDSGIGRAVALAYAREGAKVAISYLDEKDDAKEIETLILSEGGECVSFEGDIKLESFCNDLIAKTVDKFGTIDILVNNAAFQMGRGGIHDFSAEEIELTFQTNIFAPFYLSKAALKVMKEGGCIINTTSIQAFDPDPDLMPYACTKAAIANFTKSLAKEVLEKGIRVNAVAPGPVWTPLIASTFDQTTISMFGKTSPFKRPAQPVELAPVYVLLASNEASYITGEIYGVTGGKLQL